MKYYERLFYEDFADTPIQDIKSGVYVVETLEAAVWCLLNTKDYKSCALKAVNLGGDTDTVAAVACGLAGMVYGIDSIPKEWQAKTIRIDYVKEFCEKLYVALSKSSLEKLNQYIPFFESLKNIKSSDLEKKIASYDETIADFFGDFACSCLIDFNYFDTFKSNGINLEAIDGKVPSANFELLKTMLTYYYRGERFCDGLWASGVSNGTILAILTRMKELLGE